MRVMRFVPVGAYVCGLGLGCIVLLGGCDSGGADKSSAVVPASKPIDNPDIKDAIQKQMKAQSKKAR